MGQLITALLIFMGIISTPEEALKKSGHHQILKEHGLTEDKILKKYEHVKGTLITIDESDR